MRKIKLLKNHEDATGLHKAGEELEVDVKTYDWLMSVYLEDRKRLVQRLNSVPFLEKTDDR